MPCALAVIERNFFSDQSVGGDFPNPSILSFPRHHHRHSHRYISTKYSLPMAIFKTR